MPSDPFYVLLPTHGRPRLLGRTLASLAACEKPPGYRETVVVENGPPAGSEALVAEASPELVARYLHVERANKSHALNRALETIDEGLVFFTDDDVQFAPGVLRCYAEAGAGRGRGTFFGGPVLPEYEGEEPPRWLRPHLPRSARGWALEGDPDHLYGFIGFNWAAFAGDVRAAGGFDPSFGPGSPLDATGQEIQMQLRLYRRGHEQVYLDGARVWHHVPQARRTLRWLLHRQVRNGIAEGIQLASHSFQGRSLVRCLLRPGYNALHSLARCINHGVRGNGTESLAQALQTVHQLGAMYGACAFRATKG